MFEKHYCTPREYHREKKMHEVVRFKADKSSIQSVVNESDMKGNGWQMMKLCDEVRFNLAVNPWGTIRLSIVYLPLGGI